MTNGDEPIQPCIIQYTIGNEITTGYTVNNGTQINGLTKREYFAAMFTQAILSNSAEIESYRANGDYIVYSAIAATGIECADALINELNKKP